MYQVDAWAEVQEALNVSGDADYDNVCRGRFQSRTG